VFDTVGLKTFLFNFILLENSAPQHLTQSLFFVRFTRYDLFI